MKTPAGCELALAQSFEQQPSSGRYMVYFLTLHLFLHVIFSESKSKEGCKGKLGKNEKVFV